MAILIDAAIWPGRGRALGRNFCHLVSDVSLEELHSFAARWQIPARAFERDHYDVPDERRAELIAAGAVEVRARDLVAALNRAGLRRPKHREPDSHRPVS